MRLTPEEMNVLATYIEKEQAKIRERTPEEKTTQALMTFQQLQRKLEDLYVDLTPEEKAMISSLLQKEQAHIHGHEISAYESIQQKLEQA